MIREIFKMLNQYAVDNPMLPVNQCFSGWDRLWPNRLWPSLFSDFGQIRKSGAPKGGAPKGGAPKGGAPMGLGPKPRKMGPRRVGLRKGGAPKRVGPRKGGGARKGGGPKFRAFLPSSRHNFHSSFSLVGPFRWILVVFEAPGRSNPTRPGRRDSHTTARELQTCVFRGWAQQHTTTQQQQHLKISPKYWTPKLAKVGLAKVGLAKVGHERFSHLIQIRRSLGMPSRKNGPSSIWDTYGISGNVFANPAASSSAPYPQELNPWSTSIEEPLHTSTAEKSERPEQNRDLKCQSGPWAKDSVIFSGGDSLRSYVADEQRLQISDLHFDKFPTPATFACWKIRFKTEVCTCSQFPTEGMLWVIEVELVDSVDDFKSSLSIRGIPMPNFEVLDARIASALNKIIHNSHFKRRISQCSTTSHGELQTIKKNASRMLNSFLSLRKDSEQDNGHSSGLDQKGSGTLPVKTVHKENGTKSQSKWCWHSQKANTPSIPIHKSIIQRSAQEQRWWKIVNTLLRWPGNDWNCFSHNYFC